MCKSRSGRVGRKRIGRSPRRARDLRATETYPWQQTHRNKRSQRWPRGSGRERGTMSGECRTPRGGPEPVCGPAGPHGMAAAENSGVGPGRSPRGRPHAGWMVGRHHRPPVPGGARPGCRHSAAHLRPPGGAANTAINLAALGAKVTLAGAVGLDAAGDELERQLEAAGVDASWVRSAGSGDWDDDENPDQQRRPAPAALRRRRLRYRRPPGRLSACLAEALRDLDAVVICDYGAGALGGDGEGRLVAALSGRPVVPAGRRRCPRPGSWAARGRTWSRQMRRRPP